MAAFENHVWFESGTPAGRQSVFAEAVTFLEQQKRVLFYLFQASARAGGQPVVFWNDQVQALAEKLVAIVWTLRNRQGQQSQINRPLVQAVQQFRSYLFDHAHLNLRKLRCETGQA